MITMKELLGNQGVFEELPHDIQNNLLELLEKINVIRKAYGKPMRVTSGLRSMEHHKNIYKKKGIPENKIPMKSKHLYGQAVDIYDPNKELQKWVLANIQILEREGLYCEDFSATENWTHFQSVPPKSGKRFFMP